MPVEGIYDRVTTNSGVRAQLRIKARGDLSAFCTSAHSSESGSVIR